MTEFALILPILLILLLGVADLGRLFAAGIVVQAASRDAAEAAAQEYVQLAQSSSVNYTELHATAQRVACDEAQQLAGVTSDCTNSPFAVAVCIHDQGYVIGGTSQPGDPNCGAVAAGSPPTACTQLQPGAGWNSALDSTGLPYVDVRLCYRFDMLTQAPLLHVGPIWLQQSSNFVAAVY